jgi:DNA-binding NtrC family response regulator
VNDIHVHGKEDKLTDTKLLRQRITASGTTITAVARVLCMSRENFYNRLQSGKFTVSEMMKLSDFLKLTDDEKDAIFFAKERE